MRCSYRDIINKKPEVHNKKKVIATYNEQEIHDE